MILPYSTHHSCFSSLAPKDIWQRLETYLVVTTSIWCVQVKDATKHPPVHSVAHAFLPLKKKPKLSSPDYHYCWGWEILLSPWLQIIPFSCYFPSVYIPQFEKFNSIGLSNYSFIYISPETTAKTLQGIQRHIKQDVWYLISIWLQEPTLQLTGEWLGFLKRMSDQLKHSFGWW